MDVAGVPVSENKNFLRIYKGIGMSAYDLSIILNGIFVDYHQFKKARFFPNLPKSI